MVSFLLVLHILSVTFVIGSLFTQSLVLVLRHKLESEEHMGAVQKIQRKVHLLLFPPSLVVAIISGLTLAVKTGAFTTGKWLHWKLIFVFIFIVFSIIAGGQMKKNQVAPFFKILIPVGVLVLATVIIYLARIKPF